MQRDDATQAHTTAGAPPYFSGGAVRLRDLLVPGLVFVLIAGLFGTLWRAYEKEEERLVRVKSEQAVEQVALRLQVYLETRLSPLRTLASIWSGGDLRTEADFRTHALPMIESLDGIQAINWIEPDGVIAWVVPVRGNERALNRSVRERAAAARVLERAARERRLCVTPPVDLFQGGRGFAGILPVVENDVVAGFINIAFRLSELLDPCFSEADRDAFFVAIHDGEQVAYDLWPDDVAPEAPNGVERTFDVGDRTWTLRLLPTADNVRHSSSSLDEWILAASIVLAAGLSVLVARLIVTGRELDGHRERLSAAAEHVPGVLYSYDVTESGERRPVYLGPGLVELLGPRTAAEVEQRFDHLFELVHPDDAGPLFEAARTLDRGDTMDIELRLRTDGGEYRWVRSLARVVEQAGGRMRWHVVLIDVEAQKVATEQQRLLLRELDHRVKNNLAAVQSLCDQTIESTDSRESFRKAFGGRIAALARTHDLLSGSIRAPIELERVLRETLAPFIAPDDERLELHGPPVRLPSSLASPMVLIFHELATNAVRHGALSNPRGSLAVHWTNGPVLELQWSEATSGAAFEPMEEGMGLRVMRGLVERQLHGVVDVRMTDRGLHCILKVPVGDEPAEPERERAPDRSL